MIKLINQKASTMHNAIERCKEFSGVQINDDGSKVTVQFDNPMQLSFIVGRYFDIIVLHENHNTLLFDRTHLYVRVLKS